MRRLRRVDYNPHHERWLISYADYVTLLLALFVVLYAMSTVDQERLNGVVSGMRTAFVETGTTSGGIEGGIPTPGAAPNEKERGAGKGESDVSYLLLRDRLETTIEAQKGTDSGVSGMQAHRSDRGLIITLAAKDFFKPGDTKILPDAMSPLNAIGTVLALSTQPLRIEGHTDDTPIRSDKYPSNWELSTARASAVARHLIDHLNIAPQRIGAAGYAQFRPVAKNDSVENRALNRRIDIVVLNSGQVEIEEPESIGGKDSSLETLLDQLPPVEDEQEE